MYTPLLYKSGVYVGSELFKYVFVMTQGSIWIAKNSLFFRQTVTTDVSLDKCFFNHKV